ncbi:MAG: Cof-type HAD-IIB family hydrolase [Clostridiales bacterium]|nr:Cof-type HAD-IIB family hydrolase [Clostridiales bacterium]MCD8365999.1 Cof-type HAD-IIB family hydrolase [Clostridiales bacterium]
MALIFFDIDGTLWDRANIIPGSTKTALRLLKENGHEIFLCSGRTRVFIQNEELLAQGFDGMLCGCGTDIRYRGQDILYKKLERDLLIRSMRMFYDYDMPVVMEGRDKLYMDADMIGRDEYGRWLLESMKDDTLPIRGNENIWEASKFSVLIEGKKYHEVIEALDDEYDFLVHGAFVMEAVPKGFSKATGIAGVCELLGADRSETWAFGDSANDLEMLDYVNTGIVMGNGSDAAKAHADYVTDDIHADGIYNACRHFSLI